MTRPESAAPTSNARWKGVFPSARCLGAAAVALLVVFPFVLAAVDHHAVERIPSHQHAVPFGEPAPEHSHEFERAHRHSGPALLDALATPIAVSPSVATAVLSLVQNAALPLLVVILLYHLSRRTRSAMGGILNDQVAIAPPTLPPALPAAS